MGGKDEKGFNFDFKRDPWIIIAIVAVIVAFATYSNKSKGEEIKPVNSEVLIENVEKSEPKETEGFFIALGNWFEKKGDSLNDWFNKKTKANHQELLEEMKDSTSPGTVKEAESDPKQ